MAQYLPATQQDKLDMLSAMGLQSMDDLFASVPENARLQTLDIPEGKSEMQVASMVEHISAKNRQYHHIFRGAGAYDHFIPSIVTTVTSKEEFVTAYTPYQAEISQGILQSIFEYQTQICELTGMEVSNASVYDGATAAAEAVMMCQERKKHGVVMASTADPQTIQTVATYCESREVEMHMLEAQDYSIDLDALKSALTPETACVYVQSPNFYGILEDVDTIVALAHEVGAKVIMGANPISLGMLKTPGEYGVDVAVGEGQPLGMPLSFGGPYLGYMATTKKMMRNLPGRIAGETVDTQGRRAFVLTLQAREQHIRREKASSNICSNQALCAMTASVYMAAMGPDGLRRVAENSASHAHYLAKRLQEIDGFNLVTSKPFFNEFVMTCPIDTNVLQAKLDEYSILAGLPVDEGILWCATEKNSKQDIDALVEAIRRIVEEEQVK